MTDGDGARQQDRVTRFRRWLAYKLLPGTNEFDVAKSRQAALFELKWYYEETNDLEKLKGIRHASQRLSDQIPVRERWDKSDELRLDKDE